MLDAYNAVLSATLYPQIVSDNAFISGPDIICQSNPTFTLNKIPDGLTISWSVTPSNLVVNSSGSNTTANLQAASSRISNSATLTFNITSACGTYQVCKSIWVGKPRGVTTNPSGVPAIEAQIGSIFNINATSVPGATTSSLNWWTNNSSALGLIPGDGVCVIECLAIGYNYVYVTSSNTCGTSPYRLIPVDVTSEGGGGQQYLTLSPNPSNGVFDIELKDLDSLLLDQKIEIIIYNSDQNKVFQSTFYGESITIDLSNQKKEFFICIYFMIKSTFNKL